MKEFLSHEGHSFVSRNVDDDPDAYSELVALGWRAVPVTVINGVAVKGFDEAKFRVLLSGDGEV